MTAKQFTSISHFILAGVVLAEQCFGDRVEWALLGDFMKAIQDFRLGIPGMLIQVFGGYFVINKLIRK